MDRPGVWILSLALLGMPAAELRAEDPESASTIAGKLVCYCGTCSNQTIRDCTCGTAGQAREEIRQRLESGETPDQIVASFTERFGEQILIAPTKKGFNLVAWVTPFVVLLAAALGLLVAIRRWSLTPVPATPEGAGGPPQDLAEDPKLLERLERELGEIDD